MTDGQMVKAMARVDRLSVAIDDLIDSLLDHPNGQALREELYDNGLGCTWDCALIAESHLLHPERWERISRNTLRYKPAAAEKGTPDD